MSTENEKGLEPTAWGDPEGKGMMARINEIDFGDGVVNTPKINPPAAKPAETPVVSEKTDKKQAETSVTPVETAEEPVIDEDFFGSIEPKEEPKEEPKAVNGFDEKTFDAETEELSNGMDKKAGDKFKELRGELKELKSKPVEAALPEDARKELETLRIKSEEVEGLKKRVEELASTSAQTKMENSDEYLKEVKLPAKSLFENADKLSEIYNMEPDVLRAIIRENDRKRQNELIGEHLSEFSDFDRNEAYRMIQDFKGLVTKRELMMENAQDHLEKQESKRIDEQNRFIEEQRNTVQKIQKEIWDKYKDVIPGLLEDGIETATMKKLRGMGLSIDFSTSRAKDQAFAAFAGTVLPHVVKELTALRRELAARDRADGKEVASRPKPGESVKTTPPADNGPKSFMERLAGANFS